MSQESVGDIILRMQHFAWPDYVVFVFMLAISALVGVYFGFFKKQTTQQDYFLGGRKMKVIPVAMSLVASFVSGITLLGSPTEMYMYGIQYAYITISIVIMPFVINNVYLPVLYQLGATSSYEYLSVRFDNKVRLFGSLLFTFAQVGWLPIVIYVPALAFNQVTGISIHVITPIICLVCVFYTSAGGLQAVVWTDVIQITVMFAAMALVAVKGTLDLGGMSVVWKRNWDSGRIELPNFDPSPLTRHTAWGLTIGGLFSWIQVNAVNQTMVQRYLSLPTLRKAKWSVWAFTVGMLLVYAFCFYCGLLIFARFYDCDPLQTKLAKAKDQLLPLLVMDVLSDYPGLSGVFVAGVFSAALSSLSTSLNSMAAVVLEDFCKQLFKRQISENLANWIMKSVIVLMGALCLGLVFVVEKMGTILQLSATMGAISNGPQLGLFTAGILMPWVNSQGVLVGGALSLVSMAWWCLSAQFALARGDIIVPHKPLRTDGCLYNYTLPAIFVVDENSEPSVSSLLRVSYIWYTMTGAVMTMVVASIVSIFTRETHTPPAPYLLAPQLRRFYPPAHNSKDKIFITPFDADVVHTVCQFEEMNMYTDEISGKENGHIEEIREQKPL